ncbi:hypothetical protein LY78DRAFT_138363 [Colletotrichum sublineola]|nr:hypothetical protein LY78DRAFT_138363 [Colletotrichum sublineola]
MVTMDPQNKSGKERVAATTEPTSGLFLKEGARKGKGLSQRNGGGWRVRRRLCPDGTACRARSLLRQKKQIRVHATIEQRRLCRALPGEAEDCIRHPSALLSRPLHCTFHAFSVNINVVVVVVVVVFFSFFLIKDTEDDGGVRSLPGGVCGD